MPKKSVDTESRSVLFTFEDESTEIFDLSKCPEDIVTALALHGASQKGGDSYAGAAKACEAQGMTALAYSKAQVERVIQNLYEGNFRAASGGGGGPRITMLAEAVARATNQEVADIIAKIAEADDETKAALRAHSDVKKALAEIKAERAVAAAEKAQDADSDEEEVDLAAMF